MGDEVARPTRTRLSVGLYIGACVVAAVVIGVVCLREAQRYPLQVLFLLLLLPSRHLSLRISTGGPSLSIGMVLTVASFPLLGPYGAVCALATALWPWPSVPWSKRLFNAAMWTVAWYLAGTAYWAIGRSEGLEPMSSDSTVGDVIVPLLAGVVTLTVLNLVLVTIVMALDAVPRAWRMLRLLWSPNNIWQCLLAIVAYMVVHVCLGRGGPAVAALILLPMAVAQVAITRAEIAERHHQATLQGLATALETKDPYTRGHGERVGKGAAALARHLGWEPARTTMIGHAGLLHDVGKIAVPTRVIRKDGKLTAAEYEAIQLHPLRGVELVRTIGFLSETVEGIRHHHERYDGTGYPAGLRGEEIPEFARALSVVDAYDAMTTARTYRAAFGPEEAITELLNGRRQQFDATFVDAFVEILRSGTYVPDRPPEVSRDELVGRAIPLDDDDDILPVTGSVRQGGAR